MKYYKICQYSLIGYGKDSGKFYLLDLFGKKYPINKVYDEPTKTWYLTLELRQGVIHYGVNLEDFLRDIILQEGCTILNFKMS